MQALLLSATLAFATPASDCNPRLMTIDSLRAHYIEVTALMRLIVAVANRVPGVEMDVVDDLPPSPAVQLEFTGGVVLEFHQGLPRGLVTPFGTLYFGAGYRPSAEAERRVLELMKRKFGLEATVRPSFYRMKTNGEGKALPQASFRRKDQLIPRSDVEEIWSRLTGRGRPGN